MMAARQHSGIAVLGDQSDYLLAGMAVHLHQIANHHTLFVKPQPAVRQDWFFSPEWTEPRGINLTLV